MSTIRLALKFIKLWPKKVDKNNGNSNHILEIPTGGAVSQTI